MEPAAELESKKQISISGLLIAILSGVILLALAALLVGLVQLYTTSMATAGVFIPVSAMVGAPRSTSTVTRTPFQPQTYTPTPTTTPTPTATPTPSHTPTPSATSTPAPTDTPAPPPIPDQASISGVVGHSQTLNLSCESRSAVDWARFFGVSIHELDFQNMLPKSGNPETGFVGNPNGEPGQVPPRSYGVHAGPVATLLRSYGVNAVDYRRIGFDDIRSEVAAGRPVIVWVIGDVWPGKGILYRAPDGSEVTVAHFEHTVILVGYTPDKVTVIDGGLKYSVSVDQFRSSWAALGNQAIFNH